MKIIPMEQGTDTWRDWRKQGLGGSDIHDVVAGTDLQRRDMMRRTITGEAKYFQPHVTEAMRKGVEAEPEGRRRAERALACELPAVCVQSDVDPRFRASLDGLNEDGTIGIEIKRLNADSHMRVLAKYEENHAAEESISPRYYSQIQWNLMVSEAQVFYYIGYNEEAKIPFYMIPVYPNLTYQSAMKAAALGYFSALDRAKGLPRIIGIAGFARSGKDTVASWLAENYNYVRFGHADELKSEYAADLETTVEAIEANKDNHRDGLVEYSVEKKKKHGQAVWSDTLIGTLYFAQDDHEHIVVPDIRYVNEHYSLQAFAKRNNLTYELWGVIRGVAANEEEAMSVPHVIEAADFWVDNRGDLESLYKTLERQMLNYE